MLIAHTYLGMGPTTALVHADRSEGGSGAELHQNRSARFVFRDSSEELSAPSLFPSIGAGSRQYHCPRADLPSAGPGSGARLRDRTDALSPPYGHPRISPREAV